MELRQLRYFLAVAEAENFTAAAHHLHLAQPALSQQIRALENELGVTLLERGARRSRLTDAGERMVARARRILLEVEGAKQDLGAHASGRRGKVRFGCALQTLSEGRLPALLVEFRRRFPEVEIAFREAHSLQLGELLADGQLDLALVHLGRGETAGLRVDYDLAAIAFDRLYEEPLVVAVGPRHRLVRRARVRLDELADEDFVSFGPGSTVRELVARAAQQAGFVPRSAISALNLGTVRALVSAGLGIAVIPAAALALKGARIRGVQLYQPSLVRVVALARNTIRHGSPAAGTFAAFLQEQLVPRVS
ncbi:MAG TPA: LysR family transcriptional regulator [Kofleriaceae bacterium]